MEDWWRAIRSYSTAAVTTWSSTTRWNACKRSLRSSYRCTKRCSPTRSCMRRKNKISFRLVRTERRSHVLCKGGELRCDIDHPSRAFHLKDGPPPPPRFLSRPEATAQRGEGKGKRHVPSTLLDTANPPSIIYPSTLLLFFCLSRR